MRRSKFLHIVMSLITDSQILCYKIIKEAYKKKDMGVPDWQRISSLGLS